MALTKATIRPQYEYFMALLLITMTAPCLSCISLYCCRRNDSKAIDMTGLLRPFALIFWLCTSATVAIGQVNIADVQAQAEAALVNDNPAQAAASAQNILAQDPDNFAALFILGLAQSDQGDHATAATTAAQAYQVARDESSRLQAARLVASARFRLGDYIRAEFWLRRAINHAVTEEDQLAVAREYVTTVQANPLSFQFTASVAPSDNINNGSDDGLLSFESIGLTFELPENRRALSGIAYAASARAEYRLAQSDTQRTALTAFVSGETYTLSSQSKDLLASSPNADVRAVEGRDFATVLAEVGITRQQSNLSPIGPISGSLNFGTYWEGGNRLINYRDLILQQTIPINAKSAFNLRTSVREQQALIDGLVDSTAYDVIGSYNRALENRDQMQLSLAWRKSDAGFENIYDEYRVGVSYAFAQPILNTRWSTSLGVGYRTYDEFTTTLDGRRDRFASIQTNAVFEQISYFGFSPSMSVSAKRTVSSAEEFTSSAVQVLFGIESNF